MTLCFVRLHKDALYTESLTKETNVQIMPKYVDRGMMASGKMGAPATQGRSPTGDASSTRVSSCIRSLANILLQLSSSFFLSSNTNVEVLRSRYVIILLKGVYAFTRRDSPYGILSGWTLVPGILSYLGMHYVALY